MEGDNLVITIITAVAVLIILIYSFRTLYTYYRDMYIINDIPISANKTLIAYSGTKEGTTIPIIAEGKGISYSISTWIYINPTKVSPQSRNIKNIIERGPFKIEMDIVKNELKLIIPVYGGNIEEIIYENFPTQKWINITVVVDNRRIDLWLNGKLYKSKRLNNLIFNNQNNNLLLAPSGGFDGTIGRTYYYKSSLSRREIVDIFYNGPYSTNFISKLWDRTKILIFGNMADTNKKDSNNKSTTIPTKN